MTTKELKILAYAIKSCFVLTDKEKLILADDISSAFMWTGERRREWKKLVQFDEDHSRH